MTLYTVEGVSTLGNETVIYCPSLANPDAPKLTECGAGVATALNLGYALRGFAPNAEQGSSPDVRLATVEDFENPGRVKPTLEDITYVYDPQGGPSDPGNIHYRTLKLNVKGYLLDRRGVPATEIPAVGDIVDVYYVQFGMQRRVAIDPSADGGKFEIVQKPFIIGRTRYDVALVA